MSIIDLETLAARSSVFFSRETTPGSYRRLAGLDVGEKTLGVSVSDLSWTIASPLKTFVVPTFSAPKSPVVQALLPLIQEYRVGVFVVGLPLNMNGSFGPQAQKVEKFVEELAALLPTDFCFWDERLSTVAVTRTLLEADLSRKRRKEVVDKLASSFILQGVLDYLRSRNPNASSQ